MNVKQCYFIAVAERNLETQHFPVQVLFAGSSDPSKQVARYYAFGSVETLRRDLHEHLAATHLYVVDSSRTIYEIDDIEAFLTDTSQNGVWTDIWAKPYVRKIGTLRATDNPTTSPAFVTSEGITYQVE
jgi:hypothetical protein